MKKTKRPQQACKEKKRYETGEEAKNIAKRLKIQYYFCANCNGWHLTSRREVYDL